jgi:hypothetical protein
MQDTLDEQYKQELLMNKQLDPFDEHAILKPKKRKLQWIPDTFYDLFRYKYSENYLTSSDEYKINNIINEFLKENSKNINESDIDYYNRITEPLAQFCAKNLIEKSKKKVAKNIIHDTIRIELDQHTKKPNNALLYRGNGSLKDFNVQNAYDLGKNGKNAECSELKTQYPPEMLSYGISLLSNSKMGGSECPLSFTFYNNLFIFDKTKEPDLQITSIPKKEFIQNKGHWFVNDEYDNHKSFHGYGTTFHPRRKAITTTDKG